MTEGQKEGRVHDGCDDSVRVRGLRGVQVL